LHLTHHEEENVVNKFIAMALAVLCGGYAFAQEDMETTIEFSGEMKTGIYWEQSKRTGDTEWDYGRGARMHNFDDAGSEEGRFRLNMLVERGLLGMKIRFEQQMWTPGAPNNWAFAYAYGNFIDEQLKISIGKLGDSPWGAGGPEIWNEVDNQIGIRTEVRPHAVPGLNVGFVLNRYNNSLYQPEGAVPNIVDFLMESVLGVAYTHEYFHGNFAWRLDGEADYYNGPLEGHEMIYRLEERYLRNVVEGLRIWANGYWKGIASDDETRQDYKNFLYINYAPEAFTTELRLGYDHAFQREEVHARLGFYYNILPWLSAGASFRYVQDFGEGKIVPGSPYSKIEIEPRVTVTLAPNATIAFVYFYANEYMRDTSREDPDVIRDWHRFNLRVQYTF
jgi:hypothetical protein